MMTSIGQFLWGRAPDDSLRFENNKLTFRTVADGRKEPEIVGTERFRFNCTSLEKEWRIDNKIAVSRNKSFNDEWFQYQCFCLNRGRGFGVIFLLSSIGALLAPSSPVIRNALATSAIASFVLVVINVHKVYDAFKEVHRFGKYVINIAALRKQAHTNGFLYAYEKKLKITTNVSLGDLLPSEIGNACLLPSEVQFLFHRYLIHKMVGQEPKSEVEQKKWLADFQTNNPLSDELLLYGIAQNQIERFGELRHAYSRWQHLMGPKQDYEGLETLAQDTTKKNLEMLEKATQEALDNLNKIDNVTMQTALNQGLSLEIIQAKNDTPWSPNSSIRQFINQQSQALVFDTKKTLTQTLSAIEAAKNFSLEQQINYAKHLLTQAKNMLQNHNSEYLDGPFSFAKIALEPIPLMPPRDFLAEARQHFSQDQAVLDFLDTTIN